MTPVDINPDHPIIFFDGECVMCNGIVDFILRRDRRGRLRAQSLQSAQAEDLLTAHGWWPPPHDGFVLAEGDSISDRSEAMLRIAAVLGGPWRLALVARGIPAPVRNVLYDLIARNRYTLFGRRATCDIPGVEQSASGHASSVPVPSGQQLHEKGMRQE